MKKVISIILIAALCFALMLTATACGENGANDSGGNGVVKGDAAQPVITAQPFDLLLRKNESTKGLEVKAYSDDGGSLSYKWYTNTSESNVGGTPLDGETSSILKIDTSTTYTAYYYCVVTNTNEFVSGNKTATVTTEAARVKVYSETEAPRINLQPEGADYIIGAQPQALALEVRAEVSSGELTYQWFSSESGKYEESTEIQDATESKFIPDISECGDIYYFCELTNTDLTASEGTVAVVRSAIVLVSVDYDYASFTFQQTGDETCKLTAYSGASLYPVIPNTDAEGRAVTAIDRGVFAEKSIVEVTIPDTVTVFGVKSQHGVGYGDANDGVFYNCTALNKIHFNGQIEVVGDSTFRNCSKLETDIWQYFTGLKYIGKSAFEYVNSLPSDLVIPATVESIDKYAFQFCSTVKKLSFAGNKVTDVLAAAFASMSSLEEVTLPASMTSAGDSFKGNYALKSLTFTRSKVTHGSVTSLIFGTLDTPDKYPDLVIYVPEDSVNDYIAALGAFSVKIDPSLIPEPDPENPELAYYTFETIDENSCRVTAYTGTSLTPVIPDTDADGRAVTELGKGLFASNTNITEVTIPDTVTVFGVKSQHGVSYGNTGDGVFYKCTALTKINFDGQIKTVGDYTFNSCTKLETNIWQYFTGLEYIGKGAFEKLNCLPSELVIPATVKSIDKYAFQTCTGIKKIAFAGNQVTDILGSAFASISSLEEVTLPASMTSAGDCFKGGYALKSLTLMRSKVTDGGITEINFGTTTASQYPNLVIYVPEDSLSEYQTALGSFKDKIYISSTESEDPEPVSDFTFETIDENSCRVTKYTGTSLTPVIPDTDAEGRAVTELGNGLFVAEYDSAANKATGMDITEITIPDTVTVLGTVNGNEQSGYGTESSGVFSGCSKLKTINFKGSFTKVGNFAFSNCTALETDIWSYCSNMQSIGIGAFQGLNCLPDDLVIPATVRGEIYRYTFHNSKFITLSFAGSGVTKLWNASFAADVGKGYVSSLKTATIPASVTAFNGDPFKGCYALESFTMLRSSVTDGSITSGQPFTAPASNYPKMKIYVPSDSVEAYKSGGLSAFASIIQAIE